MVTRRTRSRIPVWCLALAALVFFAFPQSTLYGFTPNNLIKTTGTAWSRIKEVFLLDSLELSGLTHQDITELAILGNDDPEYP